MANCTECGNMINGKHAMNCPYYHVPSIPTPTYGSVGWICPKCGRGNAPACMTCPCVPMEYKVTCAV